MFFRSKDREIAECIIDLIKGIRHACNKIPFALDFSEVLDCVGIIKRSVYKGHIKDIFYTLNILVSIVT